MTTALDIRRSIAAGGLSARQALESCLERIDALEPEVGAWTWLDAAAARRQADLLDKGPERGPLHGLAFGIKDIIDTADMPTEYGCRAYAGHRPSADAACVALVRRAGGIVPGKTVTTELAYFAPGKTRNPRNTAHTPGGSSSGSAAAVAADMLPLAYGTQTGGSVIRPAAYCGIVGYKASRGALPLQGVKTFCHTLDSLGAFARSVADMHLVRAALLGSPAEVEAIARPPRIGLTRTFEWDKADPAMQEAVLAAARAFEAAGAVVTDIELPQPFDRLAPAQKTVMAFEAQQNYCFEYETHRSDLHARSVELIEQGLGTDHAAYAAALADREAGRRALEQIFENVDVLLCPSAPGEAPKGLQNTGDPLFNRVWTLLGVPCVNLPGLTGAQGLPLGVQAVGLQDTDEKLLRVCQWLEPHVAGR